MTGIEMRAVSREYTVGGRAVHALRDVDLAIADGDYVSIMGPSGSGKSTLLNIIGCLDRPTSGRYILDGIDVTTRSNDARAVVRNRLIGFIFQGFNLFPALDATQQVEQVLKYCGVAKEESRARSRAVLESVGLGQRLRQKPAELSGGEKQRVAIARALAKSPSLIFADEPTSALDSISGQVIIKLLHQAAKERDAAIVVVTHDPRLESYADRVIQMEDGKILSDRMISEPQ